MEAALLPWLLTTPLPSSTTTSSSSSSGKTESWRAKSAQLTSVSGPLADRRTTSSVIKWKSSATLVESLEGYLDERRWGNLTPKK